MKLRGAVERKDAEAISGWLTVAPGGDEAQTIEILVDGKNVATILANEPRGDVKSAGFGSGACGFTYRFPAGLDPAKAARAQVRLRDTDLYLTAKAGADAATDKLAGARSVFVLGPQRSGGSIVFLGLHKTLGLSGLGESHVMPIFQRMLYAYYEYARRFAATPETLASKLDVDALKAQMAAHLRAFYHERFQGAPFVDKTPGLEAMVGAPFVREVFPAATIVVMERPGVEVVESNRRKFGVSFEDACREWAKCSAQIAALKKASLGILFLDQTELRAQPAAAARKLAQTIGAEDKAATLGEFFRTQRHDVRSDPRAWMRPLTLDTIGWTREEKQTFARLCGGAGESVKRAAVA